MSELRFSNKRDAVFATTRSAGQAQTDAGLRAYMLSVYNYMTIGLGITGLVAYGVAHSPLLNLFYTASGPTILAYAAMFAPLIFVFVLSMNIHRMSSSNAAILFFAFSAVMGLSMMHIFLVYTGSSIARVFFISSATFAGASLYGYTTKRDLSQFGSFLMMGLIGIVVAALVNLFLQSSMLQFVISIVGVVVFTGLAAYDTRRIRLSYDVIDSPETARKLAVNGALSLYLSFINLFMMMLSLLGNRR